MFSLFLNPVIFALRKRWRWGRKNYFEAPVGADFKPNSRIETLQKKYGVAFENRFNSENTLQNYTYLDLLDHTFLELKQEISLKTQVLDVGSKNFYYASVLQAFFRPSKLVGLEIDAYRLYTNFQTRLSAAQFYMRSLPNTFYQVGSLLDYSEPCDVMTLFYPFVTQRETLRWGLPYRNHETKEYFTQVSKVLAKGGICFMVNHGMEEWILARAALEATPLLLQGKIEIKDPLDDRKPNPICSIWKKIG